MGFGHPLRAHFEQAHSKAAAGELKGGLASGKTGAYDVDRTFSHLADPR
jgi:hypothetical protein